LKELTITYQGQGAAYVVGTLADDGRHTLFQYAPEALARGLQLSPIRLPLRALAYPDRPADYASLHSVPGLVYDSLPDGWGYRLMYRRIKAVGMNPGKLSTLDMLAYLGANTMGALTYAPAHAPSQDSQNWQALSLLGLAQEI
jgi:serine/threonine-protein kinase HipA